MNDKQEAEDAVGQGDNNDKCCPFCCSENVIPHYSYMGEHALKMGLTAEPISHSCRDCGKEIQIGLVDCDCIPF